MMSRSKKILELLNSNVQLPSDADANNDRGTRSGECSSPSLLHANECLAQEKDDVPIDNAVDVVMLSDITNTPENQRYSNTTAYFESEKLAFQKHVTQKADANNYNLVPSISSSESDIDVSDHDDPSYKRQKKKRKHFVYPTPLRRSSSSSSSTSSSSSDSGSSSTFSSSSDESDTNTLKPISDENNTSGIDQNEPNTERETSELEENETMEPNVEREIEEEVESPKKKSRKRNRKPEKWQQNLNKRLRIIIYEYLLIDVSY